MYLVLFSSEYDDVRMTCKRGAETKTTINAELLLGEVVVSDITVEI